jgi:homoaconitate hydratase family protein/3-isopropylmalate dehydratase small subunit
MGKTFAEKIFNADCQNIVFAQPNIVLTHDNTSSIAATFAKMGGKKIKFPDRLLIVLDHNAPPTTASLANDYQKIRNFVQEHGVKHFYDVGEGICHQIMSEHARPGMLIVGSDSHTCTAGAFNAFAAGIDRTEAAGLWKQGETWFRVPESIKITLSGKFPEGVFAKDLALWIIGMLGSDGADYLSVEFHGDGLQHLSLSDRMTLANMASEMGAKNAVFPCDNVLQEAIGSKTSGVWADEEAHYLKEIHIDLNTLFPVVAVPHHVDNVKAVSQVLGTKIHQAVIGTCTNGRIEDLRQAAEILQNKHLPSGVQLMIIPASRKVYLQAIEEGLVAIFINAGATILSPSCGPCLGTGQGIPADNMHIISTANRNFKGRMGNREAFIYLASPATTAHSALKGEIADPRPNSNPEDVFPCQKKQQTTVDVKENDNRLHHKIWNYSDINNMNTDQMFAGNLTYTIKSSEPEKVLPHLFAGVDKNFAPKVSKGDIIVAGYNFGCGSSREHPAIGLAYAGVKAVLSKSVNRIFYRSAVNQGLPVIVLPEAVDAFRSGDALHIDFEEGVVMINDKTFRFRKLPQKLTALFKAGGLSNYLKQTD